MRTILWLFAAVFCAVSAVKPAYPKTYEAGRTYVYDYAASALSGMPKVSAEMSGFHLKGSVALTAMGEGEFSLVLSAKMARVQRDISPRDPNECGLNGPMGWDEKLDPVVKGWDTMSKKAALPLLFKWKPCGHVGKLMPHPDDEQWSIDLKKGVIGMISASFKNMTSKKGDMFDVQGDENVDGKCRTAYSYTEPDENNVRQATRIRDLATCSETPTFRHSLFSSVPCEKDGEAGVINWIKGDTSTEYNITTGEKNFMILDAQTCSIYGVTPPSEKSYGMVTFVEQYLNFKEAKEASKKEMTSETTDDNVQTLQLRLLGGMTKEKKKGQTKIVAEVKMLLEKITQGGDTEKLHDNLDKLVEMLRGLSSEDLQKVWDETKDFPDRRAHLLDILSATGTEDSLQLALKLVRSGDLSDSDSAQLLRLSVIAAYSSNKLMDDLIGLAKDLNSGTDALTFRAAWLAAGTAIGKAFTASNASEKIATKVVKLATEMAARSVIPRNHGMSAEERDVLLLMTAGNTGIPQLMKLIFSKLAKENTVTVRLTAIKALRKIAPLPGSSRDVRRALFAILAEPEEDIELRANAYMVLVSARPSRFHLAVLADLLRKEPSEHLRSFISSHLRLLARLRQPSPCVASMARHARRLLRAMPYGGYEGPSRFRSRVFYIPVSEPLGLGVYGAVIYGKESTLPRSLTVGLRGVFEGNLVNFAEISVRSNETDKLLRGFLGPAGKMYALLGGQFKMGDFLAMSKTRDTSDSYLPSDVGTSITYSLFGENLFQYNSNATRKAQILNGQLPNDMISFLRMMMKTDAKGNFMPAASWDRTIYLDSNNVVATSAGIPATFDIVHSSHREGYVKALLWAPVAQLQTKTGVSYRQKAIFGLELGEKWTHVASTMDIALFPGRTAAMNWTMMMDVSKLAKGKMNQMIHLARPQMPLTALKASVKLHLGSSEGRRSKLTPTAHEMRTEKMDGKAMEMMGLKFRGSVTRAVKLRRVMDGMEDFLSTKKLLSTPMEMVMEMSDNKKSPASKADLGLMLSFDLSFKATKKRHSMEKKFPKREKATVKVLRAVKMPKDLKMKPATEPYLDMPAKPSKLVKEGTLKLMMCNMKVEGGKMIHRDMSMIGKITARFQGKGFYEVLVSAKPLKALWRLRGVMGSAGAPAVYNPNNPFSITTNAKHLHKFALEDLMKKKVVTVGTSEWSISPWWIRWWKKMLMTPDKLRKRWPDAYQCVQDVEATKKEDFYPDSVSCFRTWEMLNTFDKVKVEVKSSRYMDFGIPSDDMPIISDMFELFFTDMDVKSNEKKKLRTMEAWLSPTDRRTMRLRTTMKSWLRRLSYEKCEVDFYPKPSAVYVRTFDGNFYTVAAPGAASAGSHVVLAEDRLNGLFSVSMVAGGAVRVQFSMAGATCDMEIKRTNGKSEATPGSGNACAHAKVTSGSDRTDAVRITVRALQLSVASNGDSLVEISVGPFYHDSLHGLCGDLDREPELGEYRGGSCDNPQFFESPHKLVAHFTRKGDPKLANKCMQ